MDQVHSTYLKYARDKLQQLQDKVLQLRQCDFPFDDSRDALGLLEARISVYLEQLGSRSISEEEPDRTDVRRAARAALARVRRYPELLEHISNSVSVANLFEVHDPLCRMANERLGLTEPRIVLSSKSIWIDLPYTFQHDDFPNFSFIALSGSDPLLIPLAGHELGHLAWTVGERDPKRRGRLRVVTKAVEDARAAIDSTMFPDRKPEEPTSTEDLISREVALKWAAESFCDFVGLRLFGRSFVDALAYWVSQLPFERIRTEPDVRTRARHILLGAATKCYGILNEDERAWYTDFFETMRAPKEQEIAADDSMKRVKEAHESTIPGLTKRVSHFIPQQKSREDVVYGYFQLGVPAPGVHGLADILNAGWRAYREELKNFQWAEEDKYRKLKDLIMKTIEASEFIHRPKSPQGRRQ